MKIIISVVAIFGLLILWVRRYIAYGKWWGMLLAAALLTSCANLKFLPKRTPRFLPECIQSKR